MREKADLNDIKKLIESDKAAARRRFDAGNFDRRLGAAVRALPVPEPDQTGTGMRRGPALAWTAAMVLAASILAVILITSLPKSEQEKMRAISRLLSQSAGAAEASAQIRGHTAPYQDDQIARTELSWLIRSAYYQINRRSISKEELLNIFIRSTSPIFIHKTTLHSPETGVDPDSLQIEQRINRLMTSGRIEWFLNKLSET